MAARKYSLNGSYSRSTSASLNHVPKPSGSAEMRHSPAIRKTENVTGTVELRGSSW